jgi:hypothetical protein
MRHVYLVRVDSIDGTSEVEAVADAANVYETHV